MFLGCLAGCQRNRGFNPRRGRGDPIIRTRNPSEGTTATWGEVRANSGFEEVEMQAVPPSDFFLIKVIFCYHYFLYKVVFGERYRCVVGNRCKFRKCVGSYDCIMFT